ncbi:addiction module protein [Acinetobacter puyangensis]|uniref:addiction module protein n=1 Tax=Acinetobacter puyangensis TaxID=1096779 RepID=UPI003A4D3737
MLLRKAVILIKNAVCCLSKETLFLGEMMTTAFNIDQLSRIEKLQLLEQLWQDLSNDPDPSIPQWHVDVLVQTEELVETNQSHFVDWYDAKKQLQKK